MYADYKKETDKCFMILEAETEERFSTEMLLENCIKGLIRFEKRNFNGKIYFFYDVTEKHSLRTGIEKGLLGEKEIRKLLQSLYCVAGELHRHFLDVGGLLTAAEYIYADESDFYFCYYPLTESEAAEEMMTEFAEQLLEITDYEDEAAVELVYRFYRMIKESEKGIMRILEDALTQSAETEAPEKEQEIYVCGKEYEEPEKRDAYRDIPTVVCFLIVIIVSLCYLGIEMYPGLPKTTLDILACIFSLISLPGIALGFVDIERKK